jgi:hypothetical protein
VMCECSQTKFGSASSEWVIGVRETGGMCVPQSATWVAVVGVDQWFAEIDDGLPAGNDPEAGE